MTDVSKLSDLFVAQQRFLAAKKTESKRTEEEKNLADIDGDGKVTSTDKTLISKALQDAKKTSGF